MYKKVRYLFHLSTLRNICTLAVYIVKILFIIFGRSEVNIMT